MPKWSFIIPVKEINDYVRESVAKINQLSRKDFEIIIYPDRATEETFSRAVQISSGPGSPAMKRNLALRDAKGQIIIFIDDDSYPKEDLLDVLEKDFSDSQVAAVGGPGVTAPNSSFLQRVSGAVFENQLTGGFPERYVPYGEKRLVDDWPTVNFSIRKGIFMALGGFDCNYWPGEDTKLGHDLLVKLDRKILYNPKAIVYHHRRDSFKEYIMQIAGYGLHRGFFAKKYPKTSLRWKYFIPSAFVFFISFGGLLSVYSDKIFCLYKLGWIVYFLALFVAYLSVLKKEKNFLLAFFTVFYSIATHIVYGLRFAQGFLFTKELKSRLR